MVKAIASENDLTRTTQQHIESVLRGIFTHAKAYSAKERYINASDPAVLAAMKRMETALHAMKVCAPTVRQTNQGSCVKMWKANSGEVAERLKAAVC